MMTTDKMRPFKQMLIHIQPRTWGNRSFSRVCLRDCWLANRSSENFRWHGEKSSYSIGMYVEYVCTLNHPWNGRFSVAHCSQEAHSGFKTAGFEKDLSDLRMTLWSFSITIPSSATLTPLLYHSTGIGLLLHLCCNSNLQWWFYPQPSLATWRCQGFATHIQR